MQFEIKFHPIAYFAGEPAYELLFYRGYDDGRNGGHYMDSAGRFPDETAARKAADVVKSLNKTIRFEA